MIKNFAVLDKWSRITRACRLGRFDCIQNLFFYSLSSPFLNLKSGAVTLDVFPKASLGEIVHTFCHWLFATRMVTHWAPTKPFLTLLIIFEQVNTQDILVTLSEVRKEKKNMELREGLLTGQEGGSPCQKLTSLFFLYGTFKPVKCLSLLWKIKKSINHFPTILSFRLEFNSAIVLYLFVILGFHSFHCSLNKETQIVNLRTYAGSHSSLYQHKCC